MPWNHKNILSSHFSARWEKISYHVLFFVTACFTALLFFRYSGVNESPLARFADMMSGTAAKPFVYRTLVSWFVDLIQLLIPDSTQSALQHFLGQNDTLQNFFIWSSWAENVDTRLLPLESLLVMTLIVLCFFGFALLFQKLLQRFYAAPAVIVYLFSAFTLVCLCVFFLYGYIYDAPTLLFFTAAFLFISKKQWRSYLMIFILASLNKETSILLLLTFIIYFRKEHRLERGRYITLALLQAAIYIAIRILLSLLYNHNPNNFLHFHLVNSILFLPYWLTFGVQVIVAIMILLLLHNWSRKPALLKNALWMFVPLFVLTLPFSGLDEIRVFYEVYPVVMLLIFPSVAKMLTGKDVLKNDLQIYS